MINDIGLDQNYLATVQSALGLFRHPNIIAPWGDSRPAQISTGASGIARLGCKNHRNWGNALANSRAIFAGNWGVSGERSDQALARLAAAIASGAGVLDIQLGANDIGQAFSGYNCVAGGAGIFASPWAGTAVTVDNVAKVCFDNIMLAVNLARLAGMTCIVTLEAGSSGMAASQIKALIELNERLREAAELPINSNMILFDLPRCLWNLTGSATAITFKTGYMTAGEGSFTHEDPQGAYAAAADPVYGYAAILKSIMRPLPRTIRSILEGPSINPLNLIPNPLFNTGTSGTLAAGLTGTMPTGWTGSRNSSGSGNQTATVSLGTPADGSPGLELIVACTFTAPGDGFQFFQVAGSGLSNTWQAGDIYDMACQIVSDGSTVLAGAFPQLQFSAVENNNLVSAMEPVAGPGGWAAGPSAPYTIDCRTTPLVVQPFTTRSFSQAYLRVTGSAAGTATVRFRAPEVKKRFA